MSAGLLTDLRFYSNIIYPNVRQLASKHMYASIHRNTIRCNLSIKSLLAILKSLLAIFLVKLATGFKYCYTINSFI